LCPVGGGQHQIDWLPVGAADILYHINMNPSLFFGVSNAFPAFISYFLFGFKPCLNISSVSSLTVFLFLRANGICD
jgi:hypothetical protein